MRLILAEGKKTSTISYIDGNVEKSGMLSTDEARFYASIRSYEKIMVNHSVGEFVNDMASINGIESIWAVLKRAYGMSLLFG